MASRLFYLFVIAMLAAVPALAADKDDAGAAPVPSIQKDKLKDEGPEEPVDDNRMQMPDMPKQHPEEKPVHAEAHGKPHDAAAEESYGPVTLGARLEPEGKLEKGKEASFFLTLLNKDQAAVKPDELVERHTKKLHLLVLDDRMTDYQHLHPESAGDRWRFSFTPRTAHDYKIWADVQVKGEAPQMMAILLKGAEPCKESCVDNMPVMKAEFSGNKAELSFTGGPVAGTPAEGKVSIVSADGKPLEDLEPVMGAYAHIAAFTGDFRNLAHVHPMGAAPEKEKDRGAAPLSFMLHPEKPGVLKLFVQIKVDGENVFLPFSAEVKEPEAPAAALPPAK
ncbi:MAG: hypothetical protein EPN97_07280 [Alphaproteobacteria bacterium]|nr:MAG: hypothetical protein EPN97_07280 [Alphaproteobacteria bacterium]